LEKVVDIFKKGYYFLEDRYYHVLDKINTYVPVYKVIDPIDKAFPSFILLIALVVCLIILFSFIAIPSVALNATFRVFDDNDNPIEGAHISVAFLDEAIGLDTDDFGEVNLSLPQDSVDAMVTVSKDGFDVLNQTITINSNDLIDFTLSKTRIILQETKYTIYVVDNGTNRLIKNQAIIDFTCSTGAGAPNVPSSSTGEFKNITVSGDCGTLVAKVTAEGYRQKSGVAITKNPTTIKLDSIKTTTTINVLVKDHLGLPVSGASVKLFDSFNALAKSASTDSSGLVSFEDVVPDTYKVTASYSDGSYAEEEGVQAIAGVQKMVTLSFVELLEGRKIFMNFIDSSTKANIANVKVLIYANNTLLDSKTSDSSGRIERMVDDSNSTFVVVVWHDNYLTKIVSNVVVMDAAQTIPQSIPLTILDPSGLNNGKILVHSFDYESKENLEGAKVYIFNDAFPEIILNYPYNLSNSDGNILFEKMPAGLYFAKAKVNPEGISETKELVAGGLISLEIVLVTTEGNIEVEVVDSKTGIAISGAEIIFFDYLTDSVLQGGVTDEDGKFESEPFKSNKIIYLAASKENYINAISAPMPIIAKSTTDLKIELVSVYDLPPDRNILIDFEGFYSDSAVTNKVNSLESGPLGQRYYAKFSLLLPTDANYSNIAHHLRVGPESIAKSPDVLPQPLDFIVRLLDYANSSPHSTTVFSNCYSDDPFSNPDSCITNSAAKQANTVWLEATRLSLYELVLYLEIEENLEDGTEIDLHYQGKAIIDNSEFITEPFLQSFRIGEPICTSPDCPMAVVRFWLQDQNGTTIVLNAFEDEDDFEEGTQTELKSYSSYDLLYELHNTSGRNLSLSLSFENNSPSGIISIEDNDTYTAFSGITVEKNTITSSGSPINLQTAEEAAFTKIRAMLTSSQEQLEQTLFFSVIASEELVLNIIPTVLIPGDKSQTISGTVKSQNDLPVIGATVNIFLPDDSLFESLTTDDVGSFVSSPLPSLEPNQKIKVKASAPGFSETEVEIKANWGSYFDPKYNCIEVPALESEEVRTFTNVNPGNTGNFDVINNCEAPVEIMFNSKLKVLPETIIIPSMGRAVATFTADNPVGGEEVFLGQYPIYVKAKLQGDVRFVNAIKVLVIISDPMGSCYSIDKTSFNLVESAEDTGEITNDCAVQFNDAWAPELALDSFKAIIKRDDIEIPGLFDFNWGVKIETNLSKTVQVLFDEISEETWKEFYIPTGTDAGPGFTVNKNIIVDIGSGIENITNLKFEVIVPILFHDVNNAPSDYSTIANIKNNIVVDGQTVNVPECTESNCTWETSGSVSDAETCNYISSSCYYNSFEMDLSRESINSITFPIYNYENTAFLYFKLKGTVIQTSYGFEINKEQADIELGPPPSNLFNSSIVPIRNMGFVLGKIDPNLAELIVGGQYAVEDANIIVYSSNSNVELWLVDNIVYAKYIGEDLDTMPELTPFTIKNLLLNTTQYNLIYVDDYVNELRSG